MSAEPASIWSLVVADMQERDAFGLRKYGVPLRVHDGRKTLVDAYEEALDLAVYLRKEIAEREGEREKRELTTEYPIGGAQARRPAVLDAMKCGDSGSDNAGSNCIDKGHPDAHGLDAGGNPAKQGAPAMAVETRHTLAKTEGRV